MINGKKCDYCKEFTEVSELMLVKFTYDNQQQKMNICSKDFKRMSYGSKNMESMLYALALAFIPNFDSVKMDYSHFSFGEVSNFSTLAGTSTYDTTN